MPISDAADRLLATSLQLADIASDLKTGGDIANAIDVLATAIDVFNVGKHVEDAAAPHLPIVIRRRAS